jgi:hypothetical protein
MQGSGALTGQFLGAENSDTASKWKRKSSNHCVSYLFLKEISQHPAMGQKHLEIGKKNIAHLIY